MAFRRHVHLGREAHSQSGSLGFRASVSAKPFACLARSRVGRISIRSEISSLPRIVSVYRCSLGDRLMTFPWKENATLVRTAAAGQPDDQSTIILFEGPLLALAMKVQAMKPLDRRGLRLSLPDRHIRPHTFPDDASAALVDSIPRV